MSHDEYSRQFERNYTRVIHMIQETFRPDRDIQLILVATHSVHPKHYLCIQHDLSQMLKRVAVKVAIDLNLPIFRTDLILEDKSGDDWKYLLDRVHQNSDSSILLTKEFLSSYVS